LHDPIEEEARHLVALHGLRARQIVADRAVRLFKDNASKEEFLYLQSLMISVTRQLNAGES